MIAPLLNTTVDHFRPETSPDGAGGRDISWCALGRVRAMVARPAPTEEALGGRFGATTRYVVYLVAGADARRGDELDVTLGAGRRLRVLAVVTNSRTSYSRLDCEVVQGGT